MENCPRKCKITPTYSDDRFWQFAANHVFMMKLPSWYQKDIPFLKRTFMSGFYHLAFMAICIFVWVNVCVSEYMCIVLGAFVIRFGFFFFPFKTVNGQLQFY